MPNAIDALLSRREAAFDEVDRLRATFVPVLRQVRARARNSAAQRLRDIESELGRAILEQARRDATAAGYPHWRVLTPTHVRRLVRADLLPHLETASPWGLWGVLRRQPQFTVSTLKNDADARDHTMIESRAHQAWQAMTRPQRDALQTYSTLHTSWDLTKNRTFGSTDRHVPAHLEAHIASAMSTVGRLQAGAVVYRGEMYAGGTLDGDNWQSQRLRRIHELAPGDVLDWDHPLSSSTSPYVRRFAGQRGLSDTETGAGTHSVIFQIDDITSGIYIAPFVEPHLQSESEMLLPARSRFEVISHAERRIDDLAHSGPYHVVRLRMR